MNKIRLLYMLAASQVEAYVGSVTPVSTVLINTPVVNQRLMSFTYTASTDCYVGSTTTSLDLSANFYREYYSFTIPKGI